METKRFRNHFSIMLERISSWGFLIVLLLLRQFADIVNDVIKSAFSPESMLIGLGGIFLLLIVIVGWQYFVWSKTWIVLEKDTISIEKNTFFLSKNTIGIKNISNVNIEQNLFEMIMGTCKVKLDTDSLSTANTTDVLIILKKQKAEELRKHLVKRMNELGESSDDENVVEFDDENVEYDDKAELKDIIMNGFYSINLVTVTICLASVVGVVFAVMEMLEEGTSDDVVIEFGGFGSIIVAVGISVVSTIANLVKNFLGMYGFMAKREKNKLYIKYGLFKKVNFAIPVDRINAIQIHQTMIARIFKKYAAEMINVGMGDEENSSAYFTFYGSRDRLQRSIDALLPEFSEAVVAEFEKQPKKLIIKNIINSLVSLVFWVIVGAVAYFCVEDIPVWVIAIGVGVMVLIGVIQDILNYLSCGTSITENYLGLQQGAFSTCRTIIKFNKIQYITFEQAILEKKLGIIDGKAHILAMLGKETQTIPYISKEKAEEISRNLKKS